MIAAVLAVAFLGFTAVGIAGLLLWRLGEEERAHHEHEGDRR